MHCSNQSLLQVMGVIRLSGNTLVYKHIAFRGPILEVQCYPE